MAKSGKHTQGVSGRAVGGRCAKARRAVQLELPLPNTWGGQRARAGRKPRQRRGNVSHVPRREHKQRHPLHIVLRARVGSLRSQCLFPTVRRALAEANAQRANFRVLHFSVQADHLHLIAEADDKQALSRGMQSMAIRIAKAVNRLLFRRGPLWADRYFARALTCPRAMKNALRYVLNNFRKHGESTECAVDPCSSAVCSPQSDSGHARAGPDPVSAPTTWLARRAAQLLG